MMTRWKKSTDKRPDKSCVSSTGYSVDYLQEILEVQDSLVGAQQDDETP